MVVGVGSKRCYYFQQGWAMVVHGGWVKARLLFSILCFPSQDPQVIEGQILLLDMNIRRNFPHEYGDMRLRGSEQIPRWPDLLVLSNMYRAQLHQREQERHALDTEERQQEPEQPVRQEQPSQPEPKKRPGNQEQPSQPEPKRRPPPVQNLDDLPADE